MSKGVEFIIPIMNVKEEMEKRELKIRECKECNIVKPHSDFVIGRRKLKDGSIKVFPRSKCKDCQSEYNFNYMKKNKGKYKNTDKYVKVEGRKKRGQPRVLKFD